MKRVNKCPSWDEHWGCAISPMKNCNGCANAVWHNLKTNKKSKLISIDKACDWLKENYWRLCFANLTTYEIELDIRGLDDFRKAMEE